MIRQTFYSVFSKPQYAALAIAVAFGVFAVATWIPNIPLISAVLLTPDSNLFTKLQFLSSLLGSITTNFSVVSMFSTVLISVLFGLQVSLLTYYVRKVKSGLRGMGGAGGAGVGGLVSGMLGVGCAACGTFVLTSVLVLFGASGLLALLPFKGEEFGFLGIGLLLYSLNSLTQKINEPLVCRI